MPITATAKRYAQAVFEIAIEDNKLEEWRLDLRKIAKLIGDAEFVALIENPKLSFELKIKLVKEKLGQMNPEALNLIYLLITKNKLGYVDQIAYEYDRLLDEHYGIIRANVTTAIPLNDTEKEKISHQLKTIIGRQVVIDLQVAPEILGGFVARIGDRLIDGSVRNKLNVLKKSLVRSKS